jgi:hypothetical protein
MKEALQGEVVHEKSGGETLMWRKWRTLLLLLRGGGSGRTLLRNGGLLQEELAYKRSEVKMREERC